MTSVTFRVGDIAARIGARVQGDADAEVTGIGPIETARPGQITHLSSHRFRRFLATSRATAVILAAEDAAACATTALVVANPHLAFARASALFEPVPAAPRGVHPSAVVAADVHLGHGVDVGAHTTIEAGCEIGDGVRIGPNCVVGARCRLAPGVVLHGGVVIYRDVRIGARSVVHGGAVIGADGFGYTPDERGALVPVAQLGGVVLGADVRVGANTTIDRGTLGDTVIGDGVKIDNQVQIGHNCVVGDHTVICGCSGLAGSTRIGRHCVLAGGVGVAGDGPVEICDRVVISGMTHVSSSIDVPGVYSGGVLHAESRRWKRNALRQLELDVLARRVRALERALGHGHGPGASADASDRPPATD